MSVAQPQTPPPVPTTDNRQVTVISHSTLFYWWPVWAVGFLLGILSLFGGQRMVVVPEGTKAAHNVTVSIPDEKETKESREVYILPANNKESLREPKLHIAKGRGFGVLFATILLLVIVFTNVPLRGMSSVMVIVVVVALSIIFALAGWWEAILRHLGYLDIRINAGGYFFISSILFVIWLFIVMVYDKQIYMVFRPGQFKVCTEIGGGEQTYSTVGLTMEKRRSDLFRHWILGLGSGDLIVKTSGAQAHHFEMDNVLFIGRKVQQIEEMVRQIPDR